MGLFTWEFSARAGISALPGEVKIFCHYMESFSQGCSQKVDKSVCVIDFSARAKKKICHHMGACQVKQFKGLTFHRGYLKTR